MGEDKNASTKACSLQPKDWEMERLAEEKTCGVTTQAKSHRKTTGFFKTCAQVPGIKAKPEWGRRFPSHCSYSPLVRIVSDNVH